MPVRRLCCAPCCSRFRIDNSDFCDKHQYLQIERDKKREEHTRKYFESFRTSRYSALYHTQRWRQLKAEHLRQHPYCERCGSSDNLQVHHNYPVGYDYSSEEDFYNPDALETLCTTCHAKETVRRTERRI